MPPPSLLTSSLLPSNPLSLLSPSSSFKPTTIHKSPPTKLIKSTNTQESKPTNAQIPIKIPPPPWLLTSSSSDQLLDLQQPKPTPKKPQLNAYKSLSETVRGGRGRQAMKKIVQGIKKLTKDQDKDEEFQEVQEAKDEKERMPWARVEGMVMAFPREKKERVATRAEREMEKEEIERLREKAKRMRRWVKGKKAGVTQQVVDEILEEWSKGEELVMVKLVEPLARNMDRAIEIVEV